MARLCVINQEIDHGKLKINKPGENKFLDIALVKCDTGYGPSQREVKCQASGQWQPVTCNRLVENGNADIIFSRQTLTIISQADAEITAVSFAYERSVLLESLQIFQRRVDGSVEFYRNFTEYDNGFGDADGELWLGLKYIQELAEQGPTEVRLDMTNENNDTGYETFQDFKLTDGIKYTLNIGSRKASAVNVAECLQYNNLSPFSTYDRDLDAGASRNCAVDRHGGWWYNACSYVNLNGLYVSPGTTCNFASAQSGYCGHTHTGFNGQKGLTRSSMMMRRT
ncbi:ficolin-1-like [Ruditapes philippinarum]|uniref:ficolin-1-like n=1 Tax=Ruditapes philippinarum TaxID=129788 RepID=UPI00295BFF41|nr:ficolin-1-like [Ruditapes philippinarum]